MEEDVISTTSMRNERHQSTLAQYLHTYMCAQNKDKEIHTYKDR